MKTSLRSPGEIKKPLKIAVIGAGAVGSFYGAKLAKAGHDVIFYSRSYKKRFGSTLRIKSIWGSFSIEARFINNLEQAEPCDIILVCVKGLPDVDYKALITPFMPAAKRGRHDKTPKPVIAVMQNGINQEEKLALMFPNAVICGMLAFTCINRVGPMHIHHLDYGLVKMAALRANQIEFVNKISALFTKAGIKNVTEKKLRAARWEKLLWNIPFNTLSVVLGGVSTEKIMQNPYSERLAITLMKETRAIANADGVPLGLAKQADMLERTRKMKPYKTSMLLDYERKQPLESDLILGEAMKIAHRKKILIPAIEQMYLALKFIEHYEP